MTLAEVTCTVDGKHVSLGQDWSANCGPLGYDQARFSIPESEVRKFGIQQEAPVAFYAGSPSPFWEGEISDDPGADNGVASCAASGAAASLVNATERLPFQIRGSDAWEMEGDGEIDIASIGRVEEIETDAKKGLLFLRLANGETVASGDQSYLAIYTPGANLARYAYTQDNNRTASLLDVRTRYASSPSGSSTIINDHGLGSLGTVVDQTFTPSPILLVGMRANANQTRANTVAVRLKHFRVNGEMVAGDTFTVQQVLSHLASLQGLTDQVSTSLNLNVLPIDWQGSHAELATYVVSLQDGYCMVLGSRMEANLWENAEVWKGSHALGAKPALTPQKRFGYVQVNWTGLSGAPRRYVTAQASNGLSSVYEFELDGVQPDSTLANAVGDNLIARYSQRRFSGSYELASVRSPSGLDDVYQLKSNRLLEIEDHGMGESFTHRVQNVNYGPNGASADVGDEPSPVSLIAELLDEHKKHRKNKKRNRR